MAARKTERLVNLTILLLSSRRFVPREKIRETVEGYRGLGDESFNRAFERDKDELRAMGIPVETGSDERFFDDEPGYRIVRTDFELPPIEFTGEEAMVLGLAATVWQQASVADQTSHALAKLRAAGVDPDPSRLRALAPRLSAREAAFDPLWQAMIDRQTAQFDYKSGQRRTVQPWRLVLLNNSTYLLAFDCDRQAPRMFKLSRISGTVSTIGRPGAFVPPDDAALSGHVDALIPKSDLEVVLAIRTERAPALRRRAEQVASSIELPAGFEAYRVQLNAANAVAEIASHGADVIVLEPAGLRAGVLDQLREVAAAHADTPLRAVGEQP